MSRAIELEPDFALAWFGRARIYRGMGMLDEAMRDYTRAIELDPGLVPAYLDRAEIRLWELGDEAGVADFEAAYRIDPDGLRAGLAFAGLIEYEDPDEASRIYDRIVEIHPDRTDAWLYRAKFNRQQGRFARALDDFRQAFRVGYEDEWVRQEVIMTLLALGRYDEARTQIEDAIVANPDAPETALLRARLSALTGNHDAAREFYGRYVEVDWADQRVLVEAAYVTAASGDLRGAQRLLERYAETKDDELGSRLAQAGSLVLAGNARGRQLLGEIAEEAEWFLPVWVMLAQVDPGFAFGDSTARQIAVSRLREFEPGPEAFFPFNVDLWIWTRLYQSQDPPGEAPGPLP
jgi:tetratricopeptide (TPR) repeat protein